MVEGAFRGAGSEEALMLNASHLSASSRELNQANLGQKTGDTATNHLGFVVKC